MFALINPDLTDAGGRHSFIESPGPVPNHPSKPYWVPVIEEVTDTSTGPDKVVSSWVETVEAVRLLRTRTIRDKTAGEIDDEDQARVDRLLADTGVPRAMAKALFQLTNDVRALKGDALITAAQFKGYLRGLIR